MIPASMTDTETTEAAKRTCIMCGRFLPQGRMTYFPKEPEWPVCVECYETSTTDDRIWRIDLITRVNRESKVPEDGTQTTEKIKEVIEVIRAMKGKVPNGRTDLFNGINQAIELLESIQNTERTKLAELRARAEAILVECSDTVYAQQKWKVAHRGLKSLILEVDSLPPEVLRKEGKSEEVEK